MKDLTPIRNKIEWANYHIQQLEIQIRWFERRKPYEIVTQSDPSIEGRVHHIFKQLHPLPAFIPLRIGDAAHSLRSALDHLAYEAVGSPAPPGPNVAFPIWRRGVPAPHDYKALVNGKVKNARQEFKDALLALEPYEGGAHQSLWALDYLDIVDKHRLPIAAYFRAGLQLSSSFGGGPPAPIAARFRAMGEEVEPLKDGDIVLSDGPRPVSPDFPIKNEAEPFIEIALNEPGLLAGEPPIKALTEMSQFVDDLIKALHPLV